MGIDLDSLETVQRQMMESVSGYQMFRHQSSNYRERRARSHKAKKGAQKKQQQQQQQDQGPPFPLQALSAEFHCLIRSYLDQASVYRVWEVCWWALQTYLIENPDYSTQLGLRTKTRETWRPRRSGARARLCLHESSSSEEEDE